MNVESRTHWVMGIDIAAASFVATWEDPTHPTHRPQTIPRTEPALHAFIHTLAAAGVDPARTRVAMEATGSYWIRVAVALHTAGYTICVLNPHHVHHFAKSLPRHAKTDRIDAQIIRQFALERQPPAWTPPPAAYHELRQRLMARDALLEMRQQTRNQRHALRQWPVVVAPVMAHFESVLQTLDSELASIDATIATLLRDPAWGTAAALLQSIPGVGPQCAAWLLITTMNFTLFPSAAALASYAGLSPIVRESGTSIRGRPVVGRGGNARLRKALYMASLSAAQHNAVLKPIYTRLRARGKPTKVAHCAIARKLIHLAWAIVTRGRPFDPTYALTISEGA